MSVTSLYHAYRNKSSKARKKLREAKLKAGRARIQYLEDLKKKKRMRRLKETREKLRRIKKVLSDQKARAIKSD